MNEERERLKKRGTDNREAFEAYLRGRLYWNTVTEEGFAKALIFYNRDFQLARLCHRLHSNRRILHFSRHSLRRSFQETSAGQQKIRLKKPSRSTRHLPKRTPCSDLSRFATIVTGRRRKNICRTLVRLNPN